MVRDVMRLLVPALLILSSAWLHAADVPEFRGPQRVHCSAETGLADTLPAGGPPLVWEKKIGLMA